MLAPAPSSALLWTRRAVQLVAGLAAYGIGIGLMVRAGIGVAPWDVLAQGITAQTGLPFGVVVNLVGALVLLLWIPIRQKPGLGTVANVLLIGPFAQVGLLLVPQQHAPILQGLVFSAGLLLVGVATGLYVGARLGVLRARKAVSHSRRTVSAESHALLLAIRVLRSAFCSSVMGPLPVVVRFLNP